MKKKPAVIKQPVKPCPTCGAFHKGPCPRIRCVVYNTDGSVKQLILFKRYETASNATERTA